MTSNANLDIIAAERLSKRLPGWKGSLQSINDKWVYLEKIALVVFLSLMCLGAFSQWFMRTVFSSSYIWVYELTKYSMLWAGFLGACIATTRLQHFRIDLVRLIKNPNLVKILRSATYVTGCIFCIIFGYATLKYITTLIEFNERDYYGYQIWPIYTVVLYFYITTAFRFAVTAMLKLL